MILISGAAGACGRQIVDAVTAGGTTVRALVRSEAKAFPFAGRPGVEVVCADMARAATLGSALDGVETAVVISSSDARMVDTQCAFVDAAKAAGVARVVKVSGQESGIGFDPAAFRFTRMHEQIERHIEASGLQWTHLRPSQFMQVYLREAVSIARSGVLALPTGTIDLAPIAIADIAAIAAAVLQANDVDAQALVMTGPETLTMAAIADCIGQVIGRAVSYRALSLAERRSLLLAAGVPAEMADALEEQAAERLRHPRSRVELQTHERFDVRPTRFAEFAARHQAEFSGASVAGRAGT